MKVHSWKVSESRTNGICLVKEPEGAIKGLDSSRIIYEKHSVKLKYLRIGVWLRKIKRTSFYDDFMKVFVWILITLLMTKYKKMKTIIT